MSIREGTATNEKDVHWVHCHASTKWERKDEGTAKCLMLQLHITSHSKEQNKQHIKRTRLIFALGFVYHFFAGFHLVFRAIPSFYGSVIVFDFIFFRLSFARFVPICPSCSSFPLCICHYYLCSCVSGLVSAVCTIHVRLFPFSVVICVSVSRFFLHFILFISSS